MKRIVLKGDNDNLGLQGSVPNGVMISLSGLTLVETTGTTEYTHNKVLYLGNNKIILYTSTMNFIGAKPLSLSTDNGITFNKISDVKIGPTYNQQNSYRDTCVLNNGSIIAINPDNTLTGLTIRSDDDGYNWYSFGSSLYTGLTSSNANICCITNIGGDVLLGGCTDAKIIKSIDSGNTWTIIKTISNENFISTICNMGNGVILAGSTFSGSGSYGGKIYRSTDNGETWDNGTTLYVTKTNGLGNKMRYVWDICQSNGYIYVVTFIHGYPTIIGDAEVLRSNDGLTWINVSQNSQQVFKYVSSFENNVLYTFENTGLAYSDDFGYNWIETGNDNLFNQTCSIGGGKLFVVGGYQYKIIS